MSPHTRNNVEFRIRPHAPNRDSQESMNASRIQDWIEAIRDMAIVLAFQMMLRATLMMRRWNY
jgi:hypothetical protein